MSDAGARGAFSSSDAGMGGPSQGALSTAKRQGIPDAGPPDAEDGGACVGLDSSQAARLYLSADDSNSMASPVIARSLVRGGQKVPPEIVRTYEFLNYYNVPFTQPAPGSLSLSLQARAQTSGDYELQIGVQSAPAASPRRAMNLVFVLDTSGSMGGAPIALEQAAVRAIASQVRAGDVVSVVTWNTAQGVPLEGHVASGPNDAALLDVVNGLTADGGTDLDGGLQKGYALAQAAFDPGRINRVILISDGMANVGVTNEKLIGAKAEDQDKEAIYLVGIGVGDGVNDTLMNVVTDAGRGAYVYLDSADEANAMLAGLFDEVMDIAARGVQVELELPWYFQMKQFYGEEYSADPKQVKPQHLAPGDAMVFQQIIHACTSQAAPGTDVVKATARWTDPFDYSAKSVTLQRSFAELATASSRELLRGRAIVKWAEALKLSGQEAKDALADVLASADGSDPAHADPSLNEIRSLVPLVKP